MTREIDVAGDVPALRTNVGAWRRAGERIAVVPTMGALHAGHLSLVERARREADRVVVSIFVNPTQFAPTEDLSRYPRTFEADRAALAGLADVIFAPDAAEMYRPGDATTINVAGPATVGLEDRFRPTHFAGVATVVAKLLIQSQADVAVFGEKDYQQLKVVTRMAADLFLPVRIVPGETAREADGLALSSRNRYLSPQDRATAPVLHRTLDACARDIRGGEAIETALDRARETITTAGFRIDYVEARNADDLTPVSATSEPIRLLAAATLGTTRLIDNIPV